MTTINYEYDDESSIDESHKCPICRKPFNQPVTTLCDHTYCQACIQCWLSQDHSSCPECQQNLSANDLTPITTRLVLNILDRLLVKCILCEQNQIQRGNFAEHLSRFCPKAIVTCTASDVKCPWSGTRDELENHLVTCNYERLRSVLGEIITINKKFEEQIQTLTNHVQTLQLAGKYKIIMYENKIDPFSS